MLLLTRQLTDEQVKRAEGRPLRILVFMEPGAVLYDHEGGGSVVVPSPPKNDRERPVSHPVRESVEEVYAQIGRLVEAERTMAMSPQVPTGPPIAPPFPPAGGA